MAIRVHRRCIASSRAMHLLLAAAAVAALSLRAAVAVSRVDPGGSASASADGGNGTLTWCSGGEYAPHRVVGGPRYPAFLASLQEAIDDAVRAPDRSRSYAVGTGPEYALAQCRRDVPPGVCSRCLRARRGSILARDHGACEAGGARSGLCLLRYGVQDFGRFDSNEAMAAVRDAARSPPAGITGDVVYRLLDAVAANATAGDGPARTVAGVADYGRGTAAVYGLAQCITQLSAQNCSRCLAGALSRLSDEFDSSAAGMQLLRPSCMLQYSSSAFFNASLLPPLIHVSVPDASSPSDTDADSSPPPLGDPWRPITRFFTRFKLYIGLAVGAVLALALTTNLQIIYRTLRRRIQRSRRPKKVVDTPSVPNFTTTKEMRLLTRSGNYSYETLVAATDNFSEENRLGSGGCGVVYKGVLEDNNEIAVKKLGGKGKKEMETEVSLVAQLQHENLVKFLGHCFQEGEMFLVYEYLSNKSLSNYFKDSVDYKKLEWAKWFEIIKGIARGLTYLHRDSGKDIIHRDLKPSNVLLDSNFTAKIADFDLARGYNREKGHGSTKKVAATYGYIAPECFMGSQFSPKSDVYSYGVLVLEILVGYSVRAFQAQNSMISLVEYVWQHWNDGTVEDVLDADHLGLVGHDQMKKQALQCVHVALLCVQNDHRRRPSTEEALHFLNTEMQLGDPSGLFTLMPAAAGDEGRGGQLQPPSIGLTTSSILEPR